MITIWHNPKCSKSRQTLALLEARAPGRLTVRRYLEDAPDADEISAVLAQLGGRAIDMMRRGEALFDDLGLDASDPDARLIAAMAQHPRLIERPIVLHAGRAVIARPPETALDIL